MVSKKCKICGKDFVVSWGNQSLCEELLCHRIATLRAKKRSAENRLKLLEEELKEMIRCEQPMEN